MNPHLVKPVFPSVLVAMVLYHWYVDLHNIPSDYNICSKLLTQLSKVGGEGGLAAFKGTYDYTCVYIFSIHIAYNSCVLVMTRLSVAWYRLDTCLSVSDLWIHFPGIK